MCHGRVHDLGRETYCVNFHVVGLPSASTMIPIPELAARQSWFGAGKAGDSAGEAVCGLFDGAAAAVGLLCGLVRLGGRRRRRGLAGK